MEWSGLRRVALDCFRGGVWRGMSGECVWLGSLRVGDLVCFGLLSARHAITAAAAAAAVTHAEHPFWSWGIAPN